MRYTLLLLLLLGPAVHAGEEFFDYARVLESRPILERQRVPVRERVCAPAPAAVLSGDARQRRPNATLGELIRADDKRRRPECRSRMRYEVRENTVGWRVTYRYAGETYVRRMQNPPGERVRVQVEISPD